MLGNNFPVIINELVKIEKFYRFQQDDCIPWLILKNQSNNTEIKLLTNIIIATNNSGYNAINATIKSITNIKQIKLNNMRAKANGRVIYLNLCIMIAFMPSFLLLYIYIDLQHTRQALVRSAK